MRIAVLGCGAIGGLFLGYLTKKGHNVIGIVKDYQKGPLAGEGLIIEGVTGQHTFKVNVDTRLREKVDLAIFATKINNLEEVVKENIEYLKDAKVITTQNGIKADYILGEYFPKDKIITGIVMFGATFYAPNRVVHNFGDGLILGNIFGAQVEDLGLIQSLLNEVFNTTILDNIRGAKYLKLLINLNNCIPAALGLSMQEVFADLECAKLAIKLNKEAHSIVTKSSIELVSLPTYPKDRIEGLVSMDIDIAAGIFSKIMTSLSKEPLYGSILQSIKRRRRSEIDYINGEIVSLAEGKNLSAPLNKKIVEIVKRVEDTGNFITKDELIRQFQLTT